MARRRPNAARLSALRPKLQDAKKLQDVKKLHDTQSLVQSLDEQLPPTISEIRDQERQRLAGEIHDGIAQLVVGALCESRALRRSLLQGDSDWPEQMQALQNLLNQTVAELRQAVYDLYPIGLEELGLTRALHKYLSSCHVTFGLVCNLEFSGVPRRLGKVIEIALYRIVQEALQNAYRHAAATRVDVELGFFPGVVRVSIRDDGKGLSASLDPDSAFWSIRRRAQLINGDLEVVSRAGVGTTLTVVVPVPEERPMVGLERVGRRSAVLGGQSG